MIDGDTKYLDDEAMDFVFRQTKTHNRTTSSIVRNQGIPETPPESKFVYLMFILLHCFAKTVQYTVFTFPAKPLTI